MEKKTHVGRIAVTICLTPARLIAHVHDELGTDVEQNMMGK
jgi:hypothetical protein